MTTFVGAMRSSLGKKYLMALTGIIWMVFIVGHLTGNLLLLFSREAFNGYAFFLHELAHGFGVYAADAALLVAILIHVWMGIEVIFLDKNKARPVKYSYQGDAGGHSRKGLSSKNMIWSGTFLLVFLCIHILTFKFWAQWAYKPIQVHLDPTNPTSPMVDDLYSVVVHRFKDPFYAGFYTLAMVSLGLHLKHGAWSAFQSLGAINRRVYDGMVKGATAFAVLMTFGFILLPGLIYLNPGDRFPDPGDQVLQENHKDELPAAAQSALPTP